MSMNLKELIGDPGAVVAAGQKEGYPVDGELRDLYLEMEAANAVLAQVSFNLRTHDRPEYKYAIEAYRAYWRAADAARVGGAA